MSLTHQKRENVHALWDELADFPASQMDAALLHLMRKLSDWLGADDVVWIGAARLAHRGAARGDLQLGWRGLAIRHLRLPEPRRALSGQAAAQQDTEPGLTTQALVAGAGNIRVHRLHDGFVDMKAFRQTAHYRTFYEQAGITDRIFVGFPLNADAESFFLVDRYGGTSRFLAADVELIGYALRGLKWFQRELMLSHGLLMAGAPLSPTERRIVSLLLAQGREREIAAEMGQSPKTTHKYITEILRKYGVKGRIGLMALWLSRQA